MAEQRTPGAKPAAGYSGTPQLRKLGITADTDLVVIGQPDEWEFAEPLPAGLPMSRPSSIASADIVLAFVRGPGELEHLPAWGRRVFPAGAVWVAWPRKAAGHVSDVNENLIREEALALGLVDVKVAAIDVDWSGLKLVWRKEMRKP
jgi:hypothetical protein